ncbi:hypothetical protein FTO70_07265 [Methanosarcina sp. KYL-1]|uniref:hypothetical protein n=1 Tax=Methanosarcina sp. KYL-1 TaxID=2602068 RepID=UPI002100E5F5|nr:hypothetical protein [Methanosarcina sp. KYL-1]MCQ1535486.1 hypothetical protein [Methanosarcina sp. KYL-1]
MNLNNKGTRLLKNISMSLWLSLQKPRWEEYENIVKHAVKNGYTVTSLFDWYMNYRSVPDQKVLIMRHDIDYSISGASKMFKIERKIGVNSTFYFRWLTVNKKLIEEISKYGSEVGLHYETLATYAIKKGIKKKNDFTECDYLSCVEELKKEIINFNILFGKTYTAASHGEPINRKLGLPNNILVKDSEIQEFGLLAEAYSKDILNSVDIYISDASAKNGLWRYGVSPIEAVDKQMQVILLLTHPIHWEYNIFEQIRIWVKEYIGRQF